MSKLSFSVVLMLVAGVTVACAGSAPAPTPIAPASPAANANPPATALVPTIDRRVPTAVIPPTVTPTPGGVAALEQQIDRVDSNTADGTIVGTYRLQDFTLALNADQSARLEEVAAPNAAPTIWIGTWRVANEAIAVQFKQTGDGQPIPELPEVVFRFVNGFPVVIRYAVNGVATDVEDQSFSLGSGQRHPLVKELNKMLAGLAFLNYDYPAQDDDLYSEQVRRTVAVFQDSQGLVPTGELTAETWVALHNPKLPAAKEPNTPHLSPAGDMVNVRTGPGTGYTPLSSLYAGQEINVTGKVTGASPNTTWWRVCCIDEQAGYVRGDVASISGDTAGVPVVPPDQIPPAPTAAPAGQQTSIARRGQPLLENLPSHAADGSPVAYFTFDDGPNGGYTEQMLDVLKKYNAHATFFVVGNGVKRGEAQIRRAASEGHYIADHTFNHPSLAGISKEGFVDQAESTRRTILEVAKDLFTLDGDVRYLRPPYGATDANTRQYAADLGFTIVLWDVDPMDWRRPGTSEIAQHILSHVFPGAIVLMHDGGGDRSQSIAALDMVLAQLSAKGYKFYNIFGQ